MTYRGIGVYVLTLIAIFCLLQGIATRDYTLGVALMFVAAAFIVAYKLIGGFDIGKR